MTREDAIEILQNHHMWTGEPQALISVRKANKALNMAISALEQQPCEDAVSRDWVRKVISVMYGRDLTDIVYQIDMLPSVTVQHISNADEKHVENTLEDAVSREAVIHLVECSGYDLQFGIDNDDMCDDVRKLPSVTVRQTGEWEQDESDNSLTCNRCGCTLWANDIMDGDAHFCPNCGCRMRGESE